LHNRCNAHVGRVGKLLDQPVAHDEGSDSDDEAKDREDGMVLPRFRARVKATALEKCRARKSLSPKEQEALFNLLGHTVLEICRVVKGRISVNGQERGSADSEDSSKRKGRVARNSGVEISPEHLRYDDRRIGIIRFIAYVTDDVDRHNHTLVARVVLFPKEEVGQHGQVVIDATRARSHHSFFVRVKDLGRAVSFVPVIMQCDGKRVLDYHQKSKNISGCGSNMS
jgi:hypothetical protein